MNSCNLSNSEVAAVRYIDTPISVATVAVAVLAISMVLWLRLHKSLCYRLAVYQIVAALLRGVVNALQIVFMDYRKNVAVYIPLCKAISTILQFSSWAEFLFAGWVTFHLFFFVVCFKNFKRLEAMYVISTLLWSMTLATVPVITNSYGITETGACWFVNTGAGAVERYALWSVPIWSLLTATTVGVTVTITVLVIRISRRKNVTEDCQQRNALKQLLPLLAYPVACSVLFVPTVAKNIYDYFHCPSFGLTISNALSSDGWSFVSCLMLLVQIGIVVSYRYHWHWRRTLAGSEIETVTDPGLSASKPSYTYFSNSYQSCQ